MKNMTDHLSNRIRHQDIRQGILLFIMQEHFGGYVGVYHSKFNQNERIEIWNKVKDNGLKVILGARSSLFLPFNDLGLIVVDEEHDGSFKQQDPAPRYQARDTAIYYA